MWPDNRLRTLFKIDLPIIQAPMAGSSGLEMALAVSAAGGLGSLAGAPLETKELGDLLDAARRRTDRPLNVNFFAHAHPADHRERDARWLDRLAPYYGEMDAVPPSTLTAPLHPFDAERCAVIEAFAPSVVSFHFGLPDPSLVERIKRAGCTVISSATTVEEARWLADRGCDAVIAQGMEAGGHRGMFLTEDVTSQMGTLALVPQVADAVDVPVIAAGGIADGRGVAAAFALGASGAQVGTAFLFTDEATIDPLHRRALASVPARGTALSNVFSGRPTRVVANRLLRELGPLSARVPAFPKGFSALAALRRSGEARGLSDFSPHYAG